MKLLKKRNKSNKIINYVGHNCMMDILFLLSHFQELPNNYKQFKLLVMQYFPNLFDTKLIFNYNEEIFKQVQGSRLEDIKKYLESNYNLSSTKVQIHNQFTRYTLTDMDIENNQQDQFYHEAGYDALLTGYVFLKLQSILSHKQLSNSINQLNLYQSTYILNIQTKDSILNDKFIIFATEFFTKEQSDQIVDTLKKTFFLKEYRVFIR